MRINSYYKENFDNKSRYQEFRKQWYWQHLLPPELIHYIDTPIEEKYQVYDGNLKRCAWSQGNRRCERGGVFKEGPFLYCYSCSVLKRRGDEQKFLTPEVRKILSLPLDQLPKMLKNYKIH